MPPKKGNGPVPYENAEDYELIYHSPYNYIFSYDVEWEEDFFNENTGKWEVKVVKGLDHVTVASSKKLSREEAFKEAREFIKEGKEQGKEKYTEVNIIMKSLKIEQRLLGTPRDAMYRIRDERNAAYHRRADEKEAERKERYKQERLNKKLHTQEDRKDK